MTASFTWRNGDITPVEQWLDLSTVDDGFQEGTYASAGPIAGSDTSYVWTGLESRTYHYVRLNQLLEDGSWQSSATVAFHSIVCIQFSLGDPSKPPVTLLGFATQPKLAPEDIVASGGSLQVCPPATLYAYVQLNNFNVITNLNYTWYLNSKALERPKTSTTISAQLVAALEFPLLLSSPSTGVFSITLKSGSTPQVEGTVTLRC